MTDRELLELAAKAAGFKLEQGYGQPPEKCLFYMDSEGCCNDWNPFDDDGDALRLAVKLRIDMHFEDNGEIGNIVEAMPPYFDDLPNTRWWMTESTDENDPATATRRAIVRAAAEIGKELK